MFRTILPIAISLCIAIGGGAWSVRYALDRGLGIDMLRAGAWTASPDLGTPDASPYARAAVARRGELPLGRAEGLAFRAERDGADAPLRRDCTYRIAGHTPPSRFWTLYATDRKMTPLPATEGRPAALQSMTLLREADGSFVVTVSAHPTPGNWLPVSGSGDMSFILTLYDTPVAGSMEISRIVLPRVLKAGCDD